jgi:NADPH-dependent 2,4-dienoyl-CoA reductase/sulfur reductase-like enzyme
VLPKKAEWIRQNVVSFDPDNNKLTTSEGDEIAYEFLVVAMGLQLNYNEVRLGRPVTRALYHKNYYGRKLRLFIIS